jgi:hypothetical protein
MIAGPYSSGAGDPASRAENLRKLNEAAFAVFRAGHVPVIGVNMALPIIEAAGGAASVFDELMLPLSLALAERCDACLRIGGASFGADEEVKRFEAMGRTVFRSLGELPVSVCR